MKVPANKKQIGAAVAISCEAAMVAQFAGSNNPVGNGFGIFFLFLFITCFAGGMDACKFILGHVVVEI